MVMLLHLRVQIAKVAFSLVKVRPLIFYAFPGPQWQKSPALGCPICFMFIYLLLNERTLLTGGEERSTIIKLNTGFKFVGCSSVWAIHALNKLVKACFLECSCLALSLSLSPRGFLKLRQVYILLMFLREVFSRIHQGLSHYWKTTKGVKICYPFLIRELGIMNILLMSVSNYAIVSNPYASTVVPVWPWRKLMQIVIGVNTFVQMDTSII